MIENLKFLDNALHPTKGMREVLDVMCPLVRRYLSKVERSEPVTTNQLVEQIYPLTLAKGDAIKARTRLIQMLMYAAPRDLADCAVRGEQRRMRGRSRVIKPWLWSQSADRNNEAHVLDRKRAEHAFQKSFQHTFGFAVRRLGFTDAKRLADVVMAIYDDPTLAALEAGDLQHEASLQV